MKRIISKISICQPYPCWEDVENKIHSHEYILACGSVKIDEKGREVFDIGYFITKGACGKEKLFYCNSFIEAIKWIKENLLKDDNSIEV